MSSLNFFFFLTYKLTYKSLYGFLLGANFRTCERTFGVENNTSRCRLPEGCRCLNISYATALAIRRLIVLDCCDIDAIGNSCYFVMRTRTCALSNRREAGANFNILSNAITGF